MAYRLVTVERSYHDCFFLFKKDIYNLFDRVQFGPIQQFIRSMKNSLPALAGEIFFFLKEKFLCNQLKKSCLWGLSNKNSGLWPEFLSGGVTQRLGGGGHFFSRGGSNFSAVGGSPIP